MATAVTALNTSQLIADVLAQEMERDPRIVVLGEDVGELGGVFGATRRLKKTFGEERVRETPISEAAFIGLAVGAAQAGLRPVVELMFVDFLGVCFDQIMNQMAKNTYMSGGRVAVPLGLRTAVGSIGAAAQHSQVLSATFAHIPGLKVAYPATPGDACGLLRAAIADDNPVVFLEHKLLLKTRIGELAWAEDVDGSDQPAPFGKVRVLRDGSDVVFVSAGGAGPHTRRAPARRASDRDHRRRVRGRADAGAAGSRRAGRGGEPVGRGSRRRRGLSRLRNVRRGHRIDHGAPRARRPTICAARTRRAAAGEQGPRGGVASRRGV